MSEFDSIENKAMIWNLLYDGDVFNNIPNNRVDLIRKVLDDKINFIKSNNTGSLTELNKIVIAEIMEEIEIYKVTSNNNSSLVTSQDLSMDRQTKMESKLKTIQNDFTNLINAKKPKEIDFSDKDNMPLEDIDSILAKQIASRDEEVNNILYNEPPKEWKKTIKIGEQISEQIDDNIAVKIDDNVTPTPYQKQVRFVEDEKTIYSDAIKMSISDIGDFISKLKTEPENKSYLETNKVIESKEREYNSVDIMNKLNDIHNIQIKILDFIANIAEKK
tara:strand:- start:1244 stop:2068 length:825 start_codon:yes stop_codon:yes gene_type:complete